MIYSLVILDADLRTRAVCEQVLKSKLLSKIRFAGLATDVTSGKKLLAKTKPDILILGDDLGKASLSTLLADPKFVPTPSMIIAANSTKYSMAALKKGAVDYLLKPLAHDMLEEGLMKSLEKLSQTNAVVGEKSLPPIDQRLLIKNANGTFLVSKAAIIRCQSEEGYTTIFCQGKYPSLVLSKTLKSVETQLKEDRFVRVHQSHLVNLDAIVDLETESRGIVLEMLDGARIPVAHRRRSLLLSKLPSI
ncbi:MAG: LytTR family transcriptional regulator DNA-binding domain-containing protein [Saprospiraceae bacterium]|nr:LytTR family transcriptional regulator DNA-binding domain-containing protein [Saprospiraceae bacterium]